VADPRVYGVRVEVLATAYRENEVCVVVATLAKASAGGEERLVGVSAITKPYPEGE
jgi:hypothetical protein